MRITTWNVNGIRTLKPLREKLYALDSDIICIQETKLTATLNTYDLDEGTALVPGYHSFFSLCRTKTGYSGVATYCRKQTATPIDATDDLLEDKLIPTDEQEQRNQSCNIKNCPCEGVLYTKETIDMIRNEGRCVITNHGIFTLINVYIPALSSGEGDRYTFKLQFLHALQVKMKALREKGQHVILIGDMNICPARIDSAERMKLSQFSITNASDTLEWEQSSSRLWLRNLLNQNESNCFVDVFRRLYPNKTEAYTCWSEATRGRELNFGVRIDLIIMDKELFDDAVEDSHVWQHVMGSDHCPVTVKLSESKVLMKNEAMPKDPPPFCTQFLTKFAKRQQSITQFLKTKDTPLLSSEPDVSEEGSLTIQELSDIPPVPDSPPDSPEKTDLIDKVQHSKKILNKRPRSQLPQSVEPRKKSSKTKQMTLKSFNRDGNKKLNLKHQTSSQKKAELVDVRLGNDSKQLHNNIDKSASQSKIESIQSQSNSTSSSSNNSMLEGVRSERRKESAKVWRKLLSGPPPPPRCRHGNLCVLKTVTKSGENKGKTFFSCAFPHGNGIESNCNFFKWAPFDSKYIK